MKLLSWMIAGLLYAAQALSLEGQGVFVINNRPLLKVNQKILSLMDIVKKMDVLIHQSYPELEQNPMGRYQFYATNWRVFLEEMMLGELMKADAEEKEVTVSDGDVREEMEKRFGPNIIATLGKIGLSYEEAREMIKSDLIVQKMSWYKIYSPAIQEIAPKDIKKAYLTYIEKNPTVEEWDYQLLTIKADEKEVVKTVAEEAYRLLKRTADTSLAAVTDALTSKHQVNPTLKLVASKDYHVTSTAISAEYRKILTTLTVGEYSAPIQQVSKATGEEVWRIFHLKNHEVKAPKSFDLLYQNLQEELVAKASAHFREEYKKKLQEKFGISNADLKKEIPDDYEPFALAG